MTALKAPMCWKWVVELLWSSWSSTVGCPFHLSIILQLRQLITSHLALGQLLISSSSFGLTPIFIVKPQLHPMNTKGSQHGQATRFYVPLTLSEPSNPSQRSGIPLKAVIDQTPFKKRRKKKKFHLSTQSRQSFFWDYQRLLLVSHQNGLSIVLMELLGQA